MEKPHLSKFVFEAFDPVHEAGKQPRWYGILAEFQKGADGVYRKVVSEEMTLAQLEAAGVAEAVISKTQAAAAVRALEQANSRILALENDVAAANDKLTFAVAERDNADKHYIDLLRAKDALQLELKDALGARDNFAALEKVARGHVIEVRELFKKASDDALDIGMKLDKIPLWIRRLFRAI